MPPHVGKNSIAESVAYGRPTQKWDTEDLQTKGDRLVGMDILNQSETGTFTESMTQAKHMHVNYLAYHVPWTNIETSVEAGQSDALDWL